MKTYGGSNGDERKEADIIVLKSAFLIHSLQLIQPSAFIKVQGGKITQLQRKKEMNSL